MSRGMRVLALAVTTVAAVAAVGPAPSSAAAADQLWEVPDSATIVIRGDGSGHGKGLSQYGAYGAANRGLTAGEILDFYYPGTGRGETGGRVRVWIRGDDDRDLVVDAVRGLRVRNLRTGRSWQPRGTGARRWRVRPNRAGDNVVSYRTRRWRTWRVLDGDVELSAGRRPLTLRAPGGAARYRGSLRSVRLPRQRITVNAVPMEHYVRGVVPAEMAASWPQQALRAQAVAARTFAAHERGAGNTYYDVCDTSACQVYGGVAVEHRAADRAVAATARGILTHEGEIAFAQYSASNGGWTVDGGRPYLPAQQDPYEGGSPDYYDWRRSFTARQVERAFGLGNLTRLGVESRDGHGPRGGRVTSVRIRTAAGFDDTVTGEKFRRNLGLPSGIHEITAVRAG